MVGSRLLVHGKLFGIFFPNDSFPSLKSKFIAFLIWMQGAGRTAIRCQIAFAYTRTWMCIGAMQFATNTTSKVLAELLDLLGPWQIECMLKPAAFSIANLGMPSHVPPSKWQKINLNTPPRSNRQPSGGYNRGCSFYAHRWGAGTRRGNSNQYCRYNTPNSNTAFQLPPVTPKSDQLSVF